MDYGVKKALSTFINCENDKYFKLDNSMVPIIHIPVLSNFIVQYN